MVYLVLTRNGYEELLRQFQRVPSPLWVNKDVLSQPELSSLRSSGIAVTDFVRPIAPSDIQEVSEAAYTVKEHHPDESVWVEYVPAL
jgi:hypothetical protein